MTQQLPAEYKWIKPGLPVRFKDEWWLIMEPPSKAAGEWWTGLFNYRANVGVLCSWLGDQSVLVGMSKTQASDLSHDIDAAFLLDELQAFNHIHDLKKKLEESLK